MSAATKARLPVLDGVRGLAITLVLVWHYYSSLVVAYPASFAAYANKLVSFGWMGVDIFFVLSGFLIGNILLQHRGAKNYYLPFYARRFLRIAPLYSVLLVCFVVLYASLEWQKNPGLVWLVGAPLPIWTYALQVQNFPMAWEGRHGPNWLGVTWSLAIEEQFYLLLPILFRILSIRTILRFSMAIVLVAPIMRYLLLSFENGAIAGYVLTLTRADALFIGVIGAIFAQTGKQFRFHDGMWPLAIMTYIGVLVSVGLNALGGLGSPWMASIGHSIIALTTMAGIVYAMKRDGSLLSVILRCRFLAWIGGISYGVYLLHQPVNGLVHAVTRQEAPRIANIFELLLTAGALVITLVLATCSLRLFENPIRKLGYRFQYD